MVLNEHQEIRLVAEQISRTLAHVDQAVVGVRLGDHVELKLQLEFKHSNAVPPAAAAVAGNETPSKKLT